VKVYVPGSVVIAFVVIFKVDVLSVPVLATGLVLKETLAPIGKPAVTLRVALQPVLPLPLKSSVTVYDA
jgi:hypothetical protein